MIFKLPKFFCTTCVNCFTYSQYLILFSSDIQPLSSKFETLSYNFNNWTNLPLFQICSISSSEDLKVIFCTSTTTSKLASDGKGNSVSSKISCNNTACAPLILCFLDKLSSVNTVIAHQIG